MDPLPSLRFFAPCPRGLEGVLAEELALLGARGLHPVHAGVHCEGDRACGYRINLQSRIASRVLCWVASGRYRSDDDVYRIARRQDWPARFTVRQPIRVDLTARGGQARSIPFLTLRIKDGIVDAFREHCGERPPVDTHNPEVRIFGHLDARHLHLYLDWSGEALFKRGWRGQHDKGAAPLKENLAAGLLALSGWTPQQALADLFCGSGTLLIEAAQRRCGIAAGGQRHFGFERLADFDAALWQALKEEAAQQARTLTAQASGLTPLLGMDIAAEEIARARRNALRAGLPPATIRWRQADAFLSDRSDFHPGTTAHQSTSLNSPADREPSGLIVSNPPYGERMERPANMALGRGLRDRWPGWILWILSQEEGLPGLWQMRTSRKIALMNGSLACHFLAFPLRAKVHSRIAGESGLPEAPVHAQPGTGGDGGHIGTAAAHAER